MHSDQHRELTLRKQYCGADLPLDGKREKAAAHARRASHGLEFESMHWASTVTKKPPVVTKMQGPNNNSSGHNNKSFDERLQFSPGKLFLSLDADPIEAANFQSSFAALVSAMYRIATSREGMRTC